MTDLPVDADLIEKYDHAAGVELTRLRAQNADLLAALKNVKKMCTEEGYDPYEDIPPIVDVAIAKAKVQP